MIKQKSIVGILFLMSVVCVSIFCAPSARADSYGETSYFENYPRENLLLDEATPPTNGFIPAYYGGTKSFIGFVMPSHNGSTYNAVNDIWDDGNGAVGYKALGVSETVAKSTSLSDNKARKQALFNFLKDKNKNGSAWEKMGSALIVHQMTGKPWGWGDRIISDNDAEWNDLRSRLVDNDNLIMKMTEYERSNNMAGVFVNSNGTYDAIKYYYSANDSVDAWVFYEGTISNEKYVLEIGCANPLGDLSGLSSLQYSLTPSITTPTDGALVNPGASVIANGSVKNNGPDSAGTKTWYITRLRYDSGVNPNKSTRDSNTNGGDLCADFPSKSQCDASNPKEQTFSSGQERTGSFAYTIPSNASPGTKYCFVVSIRQPTEKVNPIWRHSAMRCVTVASTAEFDLIPDIDLGRNDESVVEPGNSTRVTQTVTNQGGDPSTPTIWQLTVMTYNPTTKVTDTNGRDGANDACGSFASNGRTECVVPEGQRLENVVFNGSATQTFDPVFTYNIPDDMAVGTKICFVSSVSRPTQNSSPIWRHSTMQCLIVGKKPKVQVWGGDVRSGGKINTSTSELSGRTFGSWVEYAALSIGSNGGFSSGAALNLNGGNPSPEPSSWSRLTLANTGEAAECAFGCYNFSLSSSSLASQFSDAGTATMNGSYNLNDLASSSAPYRAGNINLTATTISRGKTIIIVADGTVTIQGDIAYENVDYTSIQDLPQVIIKAKNINIQGNVGRIDAWLIALNSGPDNTSDTSDDNGTLNTCSDYTDSLTVGVCNNRLTVNGPVVADIIYLRRTGGSENTIEGRGEPAEVFNLRADAYMWANAYGLGTGRVQTVYSRELAPRF